MFQRENEHLQKKLAEMELFLQDYGFVWVGEGETESNEENEDEENLEAPITT